MILEKEHTSCTKVDLPLQLPRLLWLPRQSLPARPRPAPSARLVPDLDGGLVGGLLEVGEQGEVVVPWRFGHGHGVEMCERFIVSPQSRDGQEAVPEKERRSRFSGLSLSKPSGIVPFIFFNSTTRNFYMRWGRLSPRSPLNMYFKLRSIYLYKYIYLV